MLLKHLLKSPSQKPPAKQRLMALTEDLDQFLNDFGLSCTAGAVTALGILDMPGRVLGADGMV
ncbi:MAG: hypothetical protein EBZ51_10885, partial [Synechococcaceae bacterium WB9_2_112]|nr:hypothetical protein [Synechococcaceae bacterium WB9_2_112]